MNTTELAENFSVSEVGKIAMKIAKSGVSVCVRALRACVCVC
jgi:hypothetical protein